MQKKKKNCGDIVLILFSVLCIKWFPAIGAQGPELSSQMISLVAYLQIQTKSRGYLPGFEQA